MTPRTKLVLDESHHRALSIRLQGLMESITEVRRLLQIDWEHPPHLKRYTGAVPRSVALPLQKLLDEIEREVISFADDFQAGAKEDDITRSIYALLSEAWVNILESDSSSLKGYGPLQSEQASLIDAKVETIQNLLLQARAVLQRNAQDE